MGIVLSAFIKATCLSSLLWFVLPLMSLLRLRLIQLSSMELTDTHTAMVPMAMLPHTPMPPQSLLLSQLSLVDMLLLADMLPTLPELSMLPRDPPMLTTHMPMVMDTHTEPTDTDMDTHTDMVTTERDLLMLSQRLMLMPLSCTELTDMVPTHMPMELTHTPTDTDTDTHMPTESTESKLFLSRKY